MKRRSAIVGLIAAAGFWIAVNVFRRKPIVVDPEILRKAGM